MEFRIRIRESLCKGCELCVRACRHGVLRMGNALNANGYHYPETSGDTKCVGCGDCVEMCPDVALALDRRGGAKQRRGHGRSRPDEG